MNAMFIVFLFALIACSSNRVQDSMPLYSKEKVCSSESLAYLQKHPTPAEVKKKISEEDIYARMLSLEPSIRKCYEDEMERTSKPHSFNLCFVVGYSKSGVMDYFEFSTREIEMSKIFKSCLSELKGRKELIGFKNLSIVQPYRFYPKK